MSGVEQNGSNNIGLMVLPVVLLLVVIIGWAKFTPSAPLQTSAPAAGESSSASEEPAAPEPPATPTPQPAPLVACGPNEAALENIPEPHRSVFVAAADQFHLSPLFLAAIFLTENGNAWKPFDHPWATSGPGARGPMQFMPGTWDQYKTDGDGDGHADVNNMYDAVFSSANMMSRYGVNHETALGNTRQPLSSGTLLRASAAYNAGGGRVSRLGELAPLSALPLETQNYVKNMEALLTSKFTRSGHPHYLDPVPNAGVHRCA